MANPLEMSKMGGQGPLGFKSDKTSFVSFSSGGYGKSRKNCTPGKGFNHSFSKKAISTALHHISDDEEPTDKRRKEVLRDEGVDTRFAINSNTVAIERIEKKSDKLIEQQILTNTLLHNIMSGRRDEDQSESIEKSVKEVELIKVC